MGPAQSNPTAATSQLAGHPGPGRRAASGGRPHPGQLRQRFRLALPCARLHVNRGSVRTANPRGCEDPPPTLPLGHTSIATSHTQRKRGSVHSHRPEAPGTGLNPHEPREIRNREGDFSRQRPSGSRMALAARTPATQDRRTPARLLGRHEVVYIRNEVEDIVSAVAVEVGTAVFAIEVVLEFEDVVSINEAVLVEVELAEKCRRWAGVVAAAETRWRTINAGNYVLGDPDASHGRSGLLVVVIKGDEVSRPERAFILRVHHGGAEVSPSHR